MDEVAALAGGLAEGAHLAQNDGPGIEAGNQQQDEDAQCDTSHIAHHLHQRAGALRNRAGRRGCATISL